MVSTQCWFCNRLWRKRTKRKPHQRCLLVCTWRQRWLYTGTGSLCWCCSHHRTHENCTADPDIGPEQQKLQANRKLKQEITVVYCFFFKCKKHRTSADAEFVLTAATAGLPALNRDVAVLTAGCSIRLEELALETIHCRIFAKSAAAGINKWLWIDVLVTGSERGVFQGVAPVQNKVQPKVSPPRTMTFHFIL